MTACDSNNTTVNQWKLEQLECLHSEDTLASSWLPILLRHIESLVKRRQSQSYKFKEFAKISNFWILKKKTLNVTHLLKLLDKIANMKWIRWVFLKKQSGHDSVHRRTDGQGEAGGKYNKAWWPHHVSAVAERSLRSLLTWLAFRLETAVWGTDTHNVLCYDGINSLAPGRSDWNFT